MGYSTGFWQDTTAKAFAAYDALIFVGATGIAVRFIAPLTQSKLFDPAVLVVDESGKFVVSLLSGHVGGANRLAKFLAKEIAAVPVITTATDVHDQIAPDAVAGEFFLRPFPKANIKKFNRAVLRGFSLCWLIDETLAEREFFSDELKKRGIVAKYVATAHGYAPEKALCVMISQEVLPLAENVLQLIPRRLIVGIGCRRNTDEQTITAALNFAKKCIGRSKASIAKIASVDLKKDEAGILAAAKKLGVTADFFPAAHLANICAQKFLPVAPFVNKIVNAGNVADSAAIADGGGNFALMKEEFRRFAEEEKKFNFQKKVTVALMWEK